MDTFGTIEITVLFYIAHYNSNIHGTKILKQYFLDIANNLITKFITEKVLKKCKVKKRHN